jgi:uncharacterized protein YjiS (DUF1127 family)
MNPRTAKTPSTLTSMPYLYLGLTDYVQLEREARRARARLIALGLRRAWTAVFGQSKQPVASTVADFSRADLLALGVPSKDVRVALFGQSLGNLIASVTQHFAALWQRAAAEAELRGLDDRTLHDMGLSRSDIPAAVAGEVYRGEQPSNENAGEAKVQVLKQKEVVAA